MSTRNNNRRDSSRTNLRIEALERREMLDGALGHALQVFAEAPLAIVATAPPMNDVNVDVSSQLPSLGSHSAVSLDQVFASLSATKLGSTEPAAARFPTISKVSNPVGSVAKDVAISEFAATRSLGGFFGDFWDGARDFGRDALNTLKDGADRFWQGAKGALEGTIDMLQDPVGTVTGWINLAAALNNNPLGIGKQLVQGLVKGAASDPIKFIGSTVANMAAASIGEYLAPQLPGGSSGIKELLAKGQQAVGQVGGAFEDLVYTFAGAVQQDRISETLSDVLGWIVTLGPRSDDGCGIAPILWVVPDKLLGLDLTLACGVDHSASGGPSFGHDGAFDIWAHDGVSVLDNLGKNLESNAQFFVDILKAGVQAGKEGNIAGAAISPAIAVVYTAAVTGVALGAAAVQSGARVADGIEVLLPFAAMTQQLKSSSAAVSDAKLRQELVSRATLLSVPQTRPVAPTDLKATRIGTNRVSLTWQDNSTNERQFVIQASSDGGSHWYTQENVPARRESATITGLKPGKEYLFRVVAQNAKGFSQPTNVLTVTTKSKGARPKPEKGVFDDVPVTPPNEGTRAPEPPTNLNVQSAGSREVTLEWNDGGAEEHYELFASNDGMSWRLIESTAANHTSAHVAVSPNTQYFFRVVAVNSHGRSAFSDQVTILTPADPVSPLAPSGLRVVSIGSTTVEVSWNEVEGESYYRVQVSTDGGATWGKQEDVPTNHAYSAKLSVEPGREYAFRVIAINDAGASSPSNIVTAVTQTPTVEVDGLRLVSNRPREVEVRWNEVDGEDHYQVQRSTDGGASWSKQEDVPSDHAYSAKLTVEPGRAYLFRVVAVNGFGAGRPSNVISVTTPEAPSITPTNLHVVSNSPREVEVRWNEVEGEDHYQVQRSTDGGASWSKQEDVPADHAYSAKLTVEPGRQYLFRVVAVNEFGASNPSNVVAVTTPDGRSNAPTNLRVVSNSPREVEVRWDEIQGEDYYRVLVSKDGGSSWNVQEDVPADHAYSARLSVSPNRTYLFKVIAVNGYGASDASNVIQVTTLGEPPVAPDNLRLVAKRTDEVEVKWSEVSGEDKYTVQVSTDGGKTWKKQEDVPADHAYSARLTVTRGRTYWFRVIAVNEFGASLPSNELKVSA